MKKLIAAVLTIGCLSLSKAQPAPTNNAASFTNIIVYNFVVTAPTSPSNSFSLQNVMSYMDKHGVIGLIPTDIANNPAALNRPNILRACDIIYSSANYDMWDATNNPTGAFAVQNGKRASGGLDWQQTTPFLASDVYFVFDSDEPAHSLHYAGNVATNTANGSPLTFSSTLRGELWDETGKPIAQYYNGESVATHPINRLLCLIREGWYVTDSNGLGLDLNYFKNHMTIGFCTQFYMMNGQGQSKCQSSSPWLDVIGTTNVNGQGYGVFSLEGQRQLGMTYTIEGVPNNLNRSILWNNLWTDLVDGYTFVGPYWPNGFFRAMEGSVVIPPPAPPNPNFLLKSQISVQSLPVLQISNGPE